MIDLESNIRAEGNSFHGRLSIHDHFKQDPHEEIRSYFQLILHLPPHAPPSTNHSIPPHLEVQQRHAQVPAHSDQGP
jgi:hypothetical protein